MKELSIEEKAKAYDNVREKIAVRFGSNVANEIFSEYEESEDERIKKEIIEQINLLKSATLSDLRDKQFDSWIAWLEKQGEQKPIDKAEPKFRVGHWCIDNEDGTIFQIVKVSDNTYTYKTNEGKEYSCPHHPLENDSRLWTTKDVKDGDVLVLNNEVFIYAHRKQMYSIAVAHCFVDSAGSFYLDGEFGYKEYGKTISPATKEQRDTLLKAMADAGYTFDFEKKELKKIDRTIKETKVELKKKLSYEKV